ncbi:hypothetical protein GGR51DRAFT_559222 [Nemania sp. FL0031]|nr:hypothetical protein GGR51DRAFT_559222 [Nemania sp. FL0031]
MPTVDPQSSEAGGHPRAPAPHEPEQTLSEDAKTGPDLQPQILQVLEHIRFNQSGYLKLRRGRWGLTYDIPQTAENVWANGPDAWAERGTGAFWTNIKPGRRFLESLMPDSTHLGNVHSVFRRWVTEPDRFSVPWSKDFLVNPKLTEEDIKSNDYPWPAKWQVSPFWDLWDYQLENNGLKGKCWSFVSCALPKAKGYADPLNLKWVSPDPDESLPETFRSNEDVCGIIAQFSVSRFSDTVDLSNAAAILCLVRGYSQPFYGPEFLHGHIARWRERPTSARCDMRMLGSYQEPMLSHSQGAPPRSLGEQEDYPRIHGMHSGIFMHYMRSFIVIDPNEMATHPNPHTLGFKCLREQVTFEGFYDGAMTKLVEKRYSTVLGILPLQKPAGHYALVSICDGQQWDVREMLEGSPGGRVWSERGVGSWKRYGIYPAGLYTGVSMFQIQICVFIESWERDWTATITRIDEMVSLKFDVLDDDDRLRNLVLGNRSDAAVLYFKVIQILNNFSDTVRAAPSYLDTLSHNVRNLHSFDYWFEESYPHTGAVRHILEHNWKIVRDRQRDASDRILAKLERTSNEVKSLQSGVFNVQSITEARKSRVLNKYLLVFTIVTILFLPPTFVATFFGMHIFDASTIDTTQKIFWIVLAGLSGGTYLIAGLGLFSVLPDNLSFLPRKPSTLLGDLVTWIKNTRLRKGPKAASVSPTSSV